MFRDKQKVRQIYGLSWNDGDEAPNVNYKWYCIEALAVIVHVTFVLFFPLCTLPFIFYAMVSQDMWAVLLAPPSGLDGHNVSGDHKLIVTIEGADTVASLSPFTIQITEDTTWAESQSSGYISYYGVDKYQGTTSALDAPNQINIANGWMHYLQDEIGDLINSQYIRSVNGYGYYGEDEYKISDQIAHIGPVVTGSPWQAIYTAGEEHPRLLCI